MTRMIFHLVTRPKFEDDVFLHRDGCPINVRGLVTPLPQRTHRHGDQRCGATDGQDVGYRAVDSYRRAQMYGPAWRASQTLLRINFYDLVADMHALKVVRGFGSRLWRHEQKLT
jgi:hypothetical protein